MSDYTFDLKDVEIAKEISEKFSEISERKPQNTKESNFIDAYGIAIKKINSFNVKYSEIANGIDEIGKLSRYKECKGYFYEAGARVAKLNTIFESLTAWSVFKFLKDSMLEKFSGYTREQQVAIIKELENRLKSE
jgi:hypothetical protein